MVFSHAPFAEELFNSLRAVGIECTALSESEGVAEQVSVMVRQGGRGDRLDRAGGVTDSTGRDG